MTASAIRAPVRCLTSILAMPERGRCRFRGSGKILVERGGGRPGSCEENALAQQRESGPVEHLPLQGLESVDVSLDPARAVVQGTAGQDRGEVLAQEPREVLDRWRCGSFGLADPVLQQEATAMAEQVG